jgi:hypothetical protein
MHTLTQRKHLPSPQWCSGPWLVPSGDGLSSTLGECGGSVCCIASIREPMENMMTYRMIEHDATFHRHSPTRWLGNDNNNPYHGLTDLNVHHIQKDLPARDDLQGFAILDKAVIFNGKLPLRHHIVRLRRYHRGMQATHHCQKQQQAHHRLSKSPHATHGREGCLGAARLQVYVHLLVMFLYLYNYTLDALPASTCHLGNVAKMRPNLERRIVLCKQLCGLESGLLQER